MAKIKLTKNELKAQKDALKRFERYLFGHRVLMDRRERQPTWWPARQAAHRSAGWATKASQAQARQAQEIRDERVSIRIAHAP